MCGLREKLDDILNNPNISLERQIYLIARLSENGLSHTIELVKQFTENPEKPYNCYAYAFNVQDNESIIEVLRSHPRPYPNAFGNGFVQRLLVEGLLKPNEKGKVVVYFESGMPVHAGRIKENQRVISKWGRGHLWEHGLLEVPKAYGDKPEFFDIPDEGVVVREFLDYSQKIYKEYLKMLP